MELKGIGLCGCELNLLRVHGPCSFVRNTCISGMKDFELYFLFESKAKSEGKKRLVS